MVGIRAETPKRRHRGRAPVSILSRTVREGRVCWLCWIVFAETPRVFAAPDRPHGRGRLHHPRGYRLLRPETVHWTVCKTAYDPRSGAWVVASLQSVNNDDENHPSVSGIEITTTPFSENFFKSFFKRFTCPDTSNMSPFLVNF